MFLLKEYFLLMAAIYWNLVAKETVEREVPLATGSAFHKYLIL